MQTRIALFLLALAAVSCQDPFFSGTPRWMREQDRYKQLSHARTDRQDDSPEQPAVPRTVYASGLRFPEGDAWHSGNFSGAHMVLWKDGEEVLDIPAGHYPEPDRHRIRNGHLWWDDSDGSTTFVYRDAREVLRYPGDEILRGLLEVNGNLHTIGQRAGNGGFSYRVNGQEVFSHPSAKVMGSFDDREWEGGALMRDGDDVFYCYAQPVRSGSESAWEYRVMKGDQPVKLIPAENGRTVFDIRVWNGSVFRSELRAGSLQLFKDDVGNSVGLKNGSDVHLGKLVPAGEGMLIKGYSTAPGGYSYWLRGTGGAVQELESTLPVADFYPENPNLAAIYLDGERVKEIWDGEKKLPMMPGKFMHCTPACSAWVGDTLYATLSDAHGNMHLLVRGDQYTTILFNGCFTGVRIE